MKVLVFDNYDSFTYNLVHYIENILGYDVDVYRNNEIALDDVAKYDKILLSPGPGLPNEAGLLLPLLKRYGTTKDILGVCLGHQAIAEAFGGKLEHMGEVLHGVATDTVVTATGDIFKDIPEHFLSARYHSWQVAGKSLPNDLEVTAIDEKGRVMAIKHKKYSVRGVQFHPESVLTEHGEQIVANWLNT